MVHSHCELAPGREPPEGAQGRHRNSKTWGNGRDHFDDGFPDGHFIACFCFVHTLVACGDRHLTWLLTTWIWLTGEQEQGPSSVTLEVRSPDQSYDSASPKLRTQSVWDMLKDGCQTLGLLCSLSNDGEKCQNGDGFRKVGAVLKVGCCCDWPES